MNNMDKAQWNYSEIKLTLFNIFKVIFKKLYIMLNNVNYLYI